MNTVWFVCHPYGPPQKKDFCANVCLWNTQAPHHRKILKSTAADIIIGGTLMKQQSIHFYGEWECCSKVPSGLNSKVRIKDLVHTPLYTPYDAVATRLNTDPYVFGREFYYTCCKLTMSKYKQIAKGDIVILGSFTLSPNGKVNEMVVDTVLVVREKAVINSGNIGSFSKCFRDVTLNKILSNGTSNIVIGKSYDNSLDYSANEMFSFVPCVEACNRMNRVKIDATFTIGNKTINFTIGRNGGHIQLNASSEMKSFFDQLVGKVTGQGYSLGVYMPEPAVMNGSSPLMPTITNAVKKYRQSKKGNAPSGNSCAPQGKCAIPTHNKQIDKSK